MKQARKAREGLKRRQASWDAIVTSGMLGATTKVAKEPNGMAYHKPGSQNTKKGRSGRTAHR